MLTRSPFFKEPSVVFASVWGMRAMLTRFPSIDATVRETPSIAMEPFWTTKGRRSLGMRTTKFSTLNSPFSIIPTPSLCPCTTCPSNRPVAGIARSRFTRPSFLNDPSVDFASVSGTTENVIEESSNAPTVKQTPLTAMLEPTRISLNAAGRSTINLLEKKSRTEAISSMRPVNIKQCVRRQALPAWRTQ